MSFKTKHFDPASRGGDEDTELETVTFRAGDSVYVYNRDIILALNIALSVGRPLLISGEAGSGKSTLARNAAAVLGWRNYKMVVTSRTQARDLEWTFDALRRLGDATAGKDELKPQGFYVEPGVLWWAFQPGSASLRGMKANAIPNEEDRARDPSPEGSEDGAVVLVDEIDKADPDVPNDLLEPLDLGEFTVEDTGFKVRQGDRRVLVILTTNGERELPPAFLRRCVHLELQPPTREWLTGVAARWFPEGDRTLHRKIAEDVMSLRTQARTQGLRQPSTAEYLDAVRSCQDLHNGDPYETWRRSVRAVLWKQAAKFQLEGT